MLSALAFIGFSSSAAAKSTDDVCMLNNGDRMTGEIKSLEKGLLKFKSSYMTDAVLLDWPRVTRLESKDHYIIMLTSGKVFTARIQLNASSGESGSFRILTGAASFTAKQIEVLRIRPADQSFWKQLNGTIDYGFSYTSGNSQYQSQLAASATYNGEGYTASSSMSTVFSGQTSGDSTRRNTFGAEYWKLFRQRWFAGGLVELLSSDQQSLDLRTTLGGAIGRNLVQTSRTSLNVFSGVAVTRERYSSIDQPRATNAESLIGLNYSTFRFKSLNIGSRFLVWPSLTDPGRVRMGLNSNLRIELVKDLYWNLNLYENFDSRPPATARRNDLGITTSFGWIF